jgi:hypothetical protein
LSNRNRSGLAESLLLKLHDFATIRKRYLNSKNDETGEEEFHAQRS